jgi:hypothetical protein
MDVSFNLLTMVITRDFQVKVYSFEDMLDGLYHVTSDCRGLFLYMNSSLQCRSYTFAEGADWTLAKEFSLWKDTLHEVEMRFTHTDNLDLFVQLDIQSLVIWLVWEQAVQRVQGHEDGLLPGYAPGRVRCAASVLR